MHWEVLRVMFDYDVLVQVLIHFDIRLSLISLHFGAFYIMIISMIVGDSYNRVKWNVPF